MQGPSNKIHFLLFVNPKSGDGVGKCFLKLETDQLTIRFQSQRTAHVYIYNLFDQVSRNKGLDFASNLSRQNMQQFRIIICGGDGTIPWVLSELLKKNIDLTRIVIGILPIGTGNDFSRSLGWGSETTIVSKKNFKDFSLLVKRWMNARVGFYDMWDVQVQTFENGAIFDIQNQQQRMREEKGFKKMFSNYMGIGLDARVVYFMQRHRTNYAFLNKVAYGLVGFANFFRFMKKLQEKVQAFDQRDIQLQQKIQQQDNNGAEQAKEKLDQRLSERLQITDSDKKVYPLQPGYRCLVCLNCTSYMAGLRKVWRTKSNALLKEQRKNIEFTEQRVDDGKIQFVSFKSQLNLALQRVIRSGAKVVQGNGPFEIYMKEPKEDEITYMQIDGESIKFKNLKRIRVTKTDQITDHRLRVQVCSDLAETNN